MTADDTDDFGPENETTRREFIMLLACDDQALASLSESLGKDTTPMAIRAIALELSKASIELMEAKEEIESLRTAVGFVGALVNGLMGLSTLVHPDDEDPEMVTLRDIAQRTGAIIRENAGLEPLGKVQPGEP